MDAGAATSLSPKVVLSKLEDLELQVKQACSSTVTKYVALSTSSVNCMARGCHAMQIVATVTMGTFKSNFNGRFIPVTSMQNDHDIKAEVLFLSLMSDVCQMAVDEPDTGCGFCEL
jgi:hypothetical protein